MSNRNHTEASPPQQAPSSSLPKVIGMLVLIGIGIGIGAFWKFNQKEITPPPLVELKDVDPLIVSTIKAAENRLHSDPHSATAWGDLGITYWVNGFSEPGAYCLTQARTLEPKVGKWVYYDGLTYLPDDKESAITRIKEAADMLDSDSFAPRLRLANILSEDGRILEAEPYYRQVLEKRADNPMAQLGLGHAANANGQPEEAIQYYERCADHAYTRKAAHTALASLYLRTNQPEKANASQKIVESIEMDEEWEDPYLTQVKPYRVGKTAWLDSVSNLVRRGRFKDALPLVKKIIQYYPDTTKAHIFLGNIYLSDKKYQEAEASMREALKYDPEAVEALVQLGVSLFWQKRFDESIAMLKSALINSPELAEAQYNLGLGLASTSKTSEAKEAFAKAIRSKPGLVDAYVGLATLFLQDRQIEEAYKTLIKAREVSPNHPRVVSLLQQFERTPPKTP